MIALLLATVLSADAAAPETVGEIMKKVGRNQDRFQEERGRYTYQQKFDLKMLRGNKKLARQEKRVYTVLPSASGYRKELVSFTGEYANNGRTYPYDKPGFQYKDTDVDGDLMRELADDLANDSESRDGISMDLFPFASREQWQYDFRLLGTEMFRGRKSHRIAFSPKDKSEFGWSGELLVDAAEYQPAFVSTKLSRKIPLVVRTMLGTDFRQLGFGLTYERVAENVWFPVSYGSEIDVSILFFYKRTLTLSLVNSDFRVADVSSRVEYEPVK
ncbi:MAG: hypothetical protein K2X35_00775 [Bryobacteraceae bacterium]|nr:hypothetical protein [Bryobacteraceae bacterium]